MRTEFGFVQGIDGIHAEVHLDDLKTGNWFPPKVGIAHNPFISITGVSASGKDHLVELVSELTGLKNVGVGSLMAEFSGVPGDQVKFLDRHNHFRAKMRAAQRIIEQDQPCFINTHLVTKHYLVSDSNSDPRESGVPVYLLQGSFDKKVNPKHFVAVISNPEEILKRRVRDQARGRSREIEDRETIALHQRLTIAKTEKLAKRLGSGFSVVCNVEDIDITEENVRFLMTLTRDISK